MTRATTENRIEVDKQMFVHSRYVVTLSLGRFLLLFGFLIVTPDLVRADDDLAAKAYQLLSERCHNCHGGLSEKVQGFRVLDRDLLTLDRGEERDPYLLPGDPDASELFLRASDGSMPPEASDIPPLTEEDVELLRNWVTEGGKFPRADRGVRQFISEADILRAIGDHNRREDIQDRPFFRYFSFAHLHNNQSVTDDQLRVFRGRCRKSLMACRGSDRSSSPSVSIPKKRPVT